MLYSKNCFSLNYYFSNSNFFFFFNGINRKFYKISGFFTDIVYYRPFNRFCISLNFFLKYEIFSFLSRYIKFSVPFDNYFLNFGSFNFYIYFLSLDNVLSDLSKRVFFYSYKTYFLNFFNFFRAYFFSKVFISLFFFDRFYIFFNFSKFFFLSLFSNFNNLFLFKFNRFYFLYIGFFFNLINFLSFYFIGFFVLFYFVFNFYFKLFFFNFYFILFFLFSILMRVHNFLLINYFSFYLLSNFFYLLLLNVKTYLYFFSNFFFFLKRKFGRNIFLLDNLFFFNFDNFLYKNYIIIYNSFISRLNYRLNYFSRFNYSYFFDFSYNKKNFNSFFKIIPKKEFFMKKIQLNNDKNKIRDYVRSKISRIINFSVFSRFIRFEDYSYYFSKGLLDVNYNFFKSLSRIKYHLPGNKYFFNSRYLKLVNM